MSTNLDRIEALLDELERADAESGGQFRQDDDHEAFSIAARIERKMRRNMKPADNRAA